MKKLIYTIALVAMGMTASYAQQNGQDRRAPRQRQVGTPEERAEKAASALQTKLSLTPEQKQKVKAVELERIKKNDEFRKKDEGEMRARLGERMALMKESQDKIDAILTPEQRTTLQASRDHKKDRFKERKGNRGPRPGTPTPPTNN